MKHAVGAAFYFLMLIANPSPSRAQEVQTKALEISIMAKIDFFKWREYSNDTKKLLVEDLGNLWGGGVRVDYNLDKHWRFHIDGDYFGGQVKYKGYIFTQGNAQQYTQPNDYKGWDGLAKISYRINLSNNVTLEPNLGIVARQWTRDLTTHRIDSSLLNYDEQYLLVSPQVGVDARFRIDKDWSIVLSAALSYPAVSHEKLLFSDPAGLTAAYQQAAIQNPSLLSAANYDWTNVAVDHGRNINPMVEAVTRYRNYSCFIRYQQYTLGRSTDGGTQGVSIHQLNSTNDILSVGLIYSIVH